MSLRITVPPKLEAVLKQDAPLHGSVLLTFAEFGPWIESSGTPFFPEYTDHGQKHVTEVLQTASSLIRDEAWLIFTPSDAALLCLATLLHDSAMHLSEDGFLSLVHTAHSAPVLPGDEPWSDMWAQFLSQAARFDGRTLTRLFGSGEPIHRPGADPAKWELRDRLLIGEFIRRHHPQLAHEIAVYGVPGPVSNQIRLKNVPSDLGTLSGLIARSHGIRLRDCLKHLSSTDIREYQGVHAVFLMALLRVADYLQMQQERAPSQLLQVKRLRSPVSEAEWKAHHAILDIRNTHNDPEAVFVQAAPQDVQTYLKLTRLLRGLQAELDSCWAVLGEVYGRFGALADLGLVIRRVRSNLDQESAFAATVTYIPCEAKFDAAGADLLKLLIQPLYGDIPAVGIRELMQNAVDACHELDDFIANTVPSNLDRPIQTADVVITLEKHADGSRYVTVADRGIGMTPEVVRDYFLRAGASFRRSDTWRRQYESDTGQSRILRSGRFGVGALAAFLLGEELEVTTRHVSAPKCKGVHFSATLETEEIQLDHCARAVGTTIRIKISADHVWDALARNRHWEDWRIEPNPLRQWDFYCIEGRKVERVFINNDRHVVLPQRLSFPACGSALSPPWHRLTVSNFQDVQWRYESRGHKLICNGILVFDKSEDYQKREWASQGFSVLRPTISVFDPDGMLPLNLQRTDLATRFPPFAEALWESQSEDYIAWMLANAPSKPLVERDAVHPEYDGLFFTPPRFSFAFTREGSVPIELWAFRQLALSSVIFFPATANIEVRPRGKQLVVPLNLRWAGSDIRKVWFRCIFGGVVREGLSPFEAFRTRGRRTIIKTDFYKELRKPRMVARDLWDDITVGPSNDQWTILSSGDGTGGHLDFENLLSSAVGDDIDGLTEYFGVSPDNSAEEVRLWLNGNRKWPIEEVWRSFTEHVVIPYSLERRRRHYAGAYHKLGSVVEYYEGLRKKRARHKNDQLLPAEDHPVESRP